MRNNITAIIEPEEERLQACEKFAELAEAKRRNRIMLERQADLYMAGSTVPPGMVLADLSDADWNDLIGRKRAEKAEAEAREARQEADRQAQAARHVQEQADKQTHALAVEAEAAKAAVQRRGWSDADELRAFAARILEILPATARTEAGAAVYVALGINVRRVAEWCNTKANILQGANDR